MPAIVPSILEKDSIAVKKKLKIVSSITHYIQLDIVDNWPQGDNTLSLVQAQTIPALKQFSIEVHLMVKKPISYIKECQVLGARAVIGQVEHMDSQQGFIAECHKRKLKAGLALDLPTFLDKIDKKCLYELDMVLLMSIPAGAQGREFNKKVLGKIKRIVRLKKELNAHFAVCVDGGINPKTAKWCWSNGARQLCVGSYLMRLNEVKNRWKELSLVAK